MGLRACWRRVPHAAPSANTRTRHTPCAPAEDEQLKEEKLVLIDSLMALEDVPPTPREAAPAPGGGGGGAAE